MQLRLTNKQPNPPLPMFKALTRRLKKERIKLEQNWAAIHRTVLPSEKLNVYVKSLRRCDRLQTALNNLETAEL